MKWALYVLLGLNAALLLCLGVLMLQPRLYRLGTRFPAPEGYMLNTRFMPAAPGADCSLIRFTDRDCPHCRQDVPELRILAGAARRKGCQFLEIAPTSAAAPLRPDSGARLLEYVDMSFGRVLNPFVTPTTLLLDRSGRLRWYSAGVLSRGAVADAERALRRIR